MKHYLLTLMLIFSGTMAHAARSFSEKPVSAAVCHQEESFLADVTTRTPPPSREVVLKILNDEPIMIDFLNAFNAEIVDILDTGKRRYFNQFYFLVKFKTKNKSRRVWVHEVTIENNKFRALD